MDSKVALAEMVRESIVRALKKQNVIVPERKSDFEIDSTVMRCFHYALDLFEGCYGERIEQQLFDRFELSPEMFDNPLVLTALASEVQVGKCFGRLVAHITFLSHVCVRRAKAGIVIDDAYLDMLTSSVDHTGVTLVWEDIRRHLDAFREQSIIAGYEN